jgi:hypothetical protein
MLYSLFIKKTENANEILNLIIQIIILLLISYGYQLKHSIY